LLAAIGRRKNATPAQIALNWVATQPGSTSPLVGARTVEQRQRAPTVQTVELGQKARRRADILVLRVALLVGGDNPAALDVRQAGRQFFQGCGDQLAEQFLGTA